ncbi:hypothetical protein RM11_0028 [Bartonella quintana RM-11]|nr:hypothetical protein RM11_0028 [Bartonella quintana RM-11]
MFLTGDKESIENLPFRFVEGIHVILKMGVKDESFLSFALGQMRYHPWASSIASINVIIIGVSKGATSGFSRASGTIDYGDL